MIAKAARKDGLIFCRAAHTPLFAGNVSLHRQTAKRGEIP